MAEPILTDDRWAVIAPLLPVHRPSARGACPHIPDRAELTGILFVLETGIQWADLPPEMGCGCGMRCWRRLRDWRHASDWERLHRLLLQRMREHDQIAWERASLGSASVPPPSRR